MNIAQLNQQFGIPGVLAFEEDRGFTRLRITTAHAAATVYLQGAHLTAWQPAGMQPVIFLSRKSDFTPGKPLRGGIPIVFPWFAMDSKPDRVDGHPGPMHGFARIQEWTVESVTPTPASLGIRFTLGPTEMSRSMGYAGFLLTLEMLIGSDLRLQLTVHNRSAAPLSFEECFHTYFHVVDVHEVSLTGLQPTPYIDKMDGMALKPASGQPLTFTGPTDRVYRDTSAPCTLRDGAGRRSIHLVKTNSLSTVVWNPWKEMPDLGEWEWHEMLCVETANVGTNARTLQPGESWQMGALVSVERWPG